MATKILIVEDTDDIRDALVIAFTEAGFRVAAAARGEEAREELSKFIPDIVLLDMHLPGMSGTDILREMRETMTIPILMFTSSGAVDTVKDAIASGATDYVLKDTGMEELIARVNKHLGITPEQPVKAESHFEQVLYVGEDAATMRLISEIAQRFSVEATKVSTTKAAMTRMHGERPSIVVTELELRGPDGLSLLKSFRNEIPDAADTPVIVVAGTAPPEKRRRALSLGATAFFTKPVSAIEIEQLVRKLLRKVRQTRAA